MRTLVTVRKLLVRLGFLAGRLLPLRSRVVLATGHGDLISGNLAWIGDGLGLDRPDVPIVELTHRPGGGLRRFPGTAIHALRSGYHLATARLFLVDDYFFPMYVIRPRAGTTFVQLWHACGAFKRFGYSVLDKSFGADETYIRSIAIHSNYDLCLVSAASFTAFYAEAFRLPPERFTARLGIPRTDLFFDQARVASTVAELRRRYAIPSDRRVVLYAPTFRGERITRARDPEDLDLAALRTAIGDDHVVLLRSHPFVRARMPAGSALGGFVIDVSDHADMNELLLVADVLVTDYSSVMYEFALLGRPMAFFAPDHVAYEAERGFYFDYSSGLPGPIFTTAAEFAAWLRAGEFDEDRVRRFAAESFDVADGRATARFVDEVVGKAIPRAAG
ncbi:MAG TPA: CDP-glycerol glycerophosphotransferase family protein [Candidatus Limnocylindria bacterium]|nr:CDP-glycerol glycerophosphotransferase family protein [Candidatus Limnocylindria bacterium]